MLLWVVRAILFLITLAILGFGMALVALQAEAPAMQFIGVLFVLVGLFMFYLVIWRPDTIVPDRDGRGGRRAWLLSDAMDSGGDGGGGNGGGGGDGGGGGGGD